MTHPPARLEEPFPSDRTIRWNPLPDSYHLLAEMLRGPGDENRLVVAQGVLRQVDAHVSHVHVTGGTALGLLLGELYTCPVTGLHYTAVRGIERLPDELVSVEDEEITDATWHAIEPEIRRHGAYVLGWYRSRPRVLPQLPPIDAAAHVRRFRAPWQVAMLVSPDVESPAGAFYVYQARVGRVYSLPFHEMLEVHPVHGTTGQRTWVRWQNYVTDGDLGLLMEQAQKQAAVTRQQRRSGGLLDPLRDAFEDAWTRVRAERQPKAKEAPPAVAPPGALPTTAPPPVPDRMGERQGVTARATVPTAWPAGSAPASTGSAAVPLAAPPVPRTTVSRTATPDSSGTIAPPGPSTAAHPLRGGGRVPPRQRPTTPIAPPALSPVGGARRAQPVAPPVSALPGPVAPPPAPPPVMPLPAAAVPAHGGAAPSPDESPRASAKPRAGGAARDTAAGGTSPAGTSTAGTSTAGTSTAGATPMSRAADYPVLPDEPADLALHHVPATDLTSPLAVVLPSGFYVPAPASRKRGVAGALAGAVLVLLAGTVALLARGSRAATMQAPVPVTRGVSARHAAAPDAAMPVPALPTPVVTTSEGPASIPGPATVAGPAGARPAPSASTSASMPASMAASISATRQATASPTVPAAPVRGPASGRLPASEAPTPAAATGQFDAGLARLTTSVRDYRMRLNAVDGLEGCGPARAARAAVDTGFDTVSSALKDAGTAIDVDRSMRYNKIAADVSELERDWRTTRCARVPGA